MNTLKINFPREKNKSFTLIELLVVIAIIGLLAAIVLVSLNKARARARDARRITEMNQLSKVLQIYYTAYGKYPGDILEGQRGVNLDPGDTDCWWYWESGNDLANGTDDPFIEPLKTAGLVQKTPREWTDVKDHHFTLRCQYRYLKQKDPCGCTGTYAVIFAACETPSCPRNERPSCCVDSGPEFWYEGYGDDDPYDYVIFLKE